VPDGLNEKTLIHLHKAAYALLPVSQSVSSHLGFKLLDTASDNDVNLPDFYTDTRLCQRCGTLYLPGVTAKVRTAQSRRQKRTAKQSAWVIYNCAVCEHNFTLQVNWPDGTPNRVVQSSTSRLEDKGQGPLESTNVVNESGKKRKRNRLHSLRDAIAKSHREDAGNELGLRDLMKVV